MSEAHANTLGEILHGRFIGFQARDRRLDVHPSLEDPPQDAWDAGPPRDSSWRDLDAPPVTVETVGEHLLRVEIQVAGAGAVGARLGRDTDERFFGFGVRSDQIERTEGVVENWVGEGPYQLDEYPLVQAITPRWAIRKRRDAAYYPVPWCVSSAGYGALIDNSELSRFRFEPDHWSLEVEAESLRLRIFVGASIADVLRRFTEATGRQPYPAAPWFFGPWCQTGQADLVAFEEEERIVTTLLDAGAPMVAVETHMRRLPGGAHEKRRDAERKRTAMFHRRGLASLAYLNPFVSVDYATRFPRAEPLLQRRADGSPYLYPAYIGGRESPITTEGQLDFTAPGAEELFTELAQEAIEDGHDGWMEDFGEYTPPDAVCADESKGVSAHNEYPVRFHAAGARAAAAAGGRRPIARFVRSGWTGVAPHAPLVWGGDPTTGWGFDGLASALTQALSAGLSGIAFWGTDIGGFFTLGDQELDSELLIRWVQFGAFCPLMRTKAEGVAIPPRRRPQIWDADILPHWRRWADVHLRLVPYLLAAAREYVDTGMPLMRHMCLIDPVSRACDQYFLGPDLLVAPVLEPGCRERAVEVPAGRWIDLWRTRTISGPGTATLPAPLDEIPLLVREGADLGLAKP
jgi:alpha-glucosidase (family GH31 glycosyl hydrolase)